MWHKLVRPEDVPELPPVARKLFLSFYNVAGGSIAHYYDHVRFNQFIRHCHAKRVKLSQTAMRHMLLRVGCQTARAEKLSEIYYYCRSLLSNCKAWD